MEENRRKKFEKLIGVKIKSKNGGDAPEDLLLHSIERLCELEAITYTTHQLGINIFGLEELYISLIKTLLENQYSKEITDIIFWWVFESISPEGELMSLEDENGKKHTFKTPKQLVKYLKKYYNA